MVARKYFQSCCACGVVGIKAHFYCAILFLCLAYSNLSFSELQPYTLLDVRAVSISGAEQSWLDSGLDASRFDESSNVIVLGQAIAGARWQFADVLTLRGFASAYDDGGESFGVNQLFLNYRPVPLNGYRFDVKVGAFYPEVSLENTRPGWTSSDVLTNSAINTWIGEELRILGSEVSLTRLGRAYNSDWDFGSSVSIYTGNDPAGALLAWRGWSLHDRQVRVGEQISFAALPVIGTSEGFIQQSTSFDPFVEIDDRLGYTVSFWAKQRHGLNVKFYYYNNQADRTAIRKGQYAWHTEFHHISLALPLGEGTTILSQWLDGKTDMGEEIDVAVRADYNAWYLALKQRWYGIKLTLRYDDFEVQDLDITFMDNNNQNGRAWTFAASYSILPSVELIAEHHRFKENNYVRRYFSQPVDNQYHQSQLAVQWRF